MNQTVIGLFNSASEAQQAVQKLKSAGFVGSNVDVAAHDAQRAKHIVNNTDTTGRDNDNEDGISRFFSNLFGGDDNDDTRTYTNMTRSGGSVVTVHAASSDEAERARDILDDCGAIDVQEEARNRGYGMTGAAGMTGATGAATTGNRGNTQDGDTKSLPIIEESLQVGKRVEQTGGARIRSRIIERPVEEHVRLREEHVNIERHDANRPATEADFAAFKEGEISVTERAERAVVGKEARVVGEVSIDKEVTERDETVTGTVRKTDVDVQRLGDSDTNRDDANRTNR